MRNKKRLNCPNCAAPIIGIRCEYCGTKFLDFASIDMDYPFYIRVKQGNSLMTCKARVKEFNIRIEPEDTMDFLYAYDKPIYHPRSKNKLDMELKMESAVYDDNDILYEVYRAEDDQS